MRFENLKKFIKKWVSEITIAIASRPGYKIAEIYQDDTGEYHAIIQVINKNATFHMKPEEIAGDDNLVDLFSQKDIRTLTYLGYLDLHKPKYQVMAKKIQDRNEKLIFAIKQKNIKKIITKTANEISQDQGLLSGLSSKDAHMIGYTAGLENSYFEEEQKKHLQMLEA